MINGQKLITEELDPKEHQIIFKRIGEYATDVEFHHIHVPVDLRKFINIADQAMDVIQHYSTNLYQETKMHYNKENRYPEDWQAQAYADMITKQNHFVANVSAQSLQIIKEGLMSTTQALPQKSTRMTKRQLGLIFGFVGTAFATINAAKISQIQNKMQTEDQEILHLTHIAEIQ